jgi:PadR family transcriptional regulator, regulatory protein PadR
MPKPRTDLPQGTLDMLILKVVALEPIHGYAIAQRLQQISEDVLQVQQGSLYPALHRLENRKWLASSWKISETGREAKYYSLTRQGAKQLALEDENWERLSRAVKLVMQTAR